MFEYKPEGNAVSKGDRFFYGSPIRDESGNVSGVGFGEFEALAPCLAGWYCAHVDPVTKEAAKTTELFTHEDLKIIGVDTESAFEALLKKLWHNIAASTEMYSQVNSLYDQYLVRKETSAELERVKAELQETKDKLERQMDINDRLRERQS